MAGVIQWQIVASCQRISEAFLLPVLSELLAGFPFAIRGCIRTTARSTSTATSPGCWSFSLAPVLPMGRAAGTAAHHPRPGQKTDGQAVARGRLEA